MEIKEGFIPFMEYQTYYRIANPNGKKTPLVICHGGPGSTHNFFEIMDHVAFEDDRPIVMYDQLGCGKSIIEEGHKDLWVKETWVKELINLRKYLKLDEIHLLGHSWGGMLEIIYMCDYNPQGVKTITLSSTLSSCKLWEKETKRLVSLMDKKDSELLLNGIFSKEAKEAEDRYTYKHIFGPFTEGIDPECITRPKPKNPEPYVTAWGNSEFAPSGTLKDYEYTDRLHLIKCPVLICSGANDESTPLQNEMMLDALKTKKKWILYKNSRHMSYYEEHDLYTKNLIEFLNEND